MDNSTSPDNFDLELFFESTHDLCCIAGYDGYFRKINPAVIKTLGYTEAELLSKKISEFVLPEDRARTAETRQEMLKTGALLHFENRYMAKDGSIVWLSWTSIPSEQNQYVYAIAKDITHKKHLEEERNQLLGNLTKINAELKRFSYTTSHDLRSPVNNLLTVFSLMDTSKIEDLETLELIEILKATTNVIKDTLNGCLDILDQDIRLNAELEELNLNTSLDRVKKSISTLLRDSKVVFMTDFSKFETVEFNNAFLDSIFLNLITNSIKYARPDCPPVISISSENVDGVNRLVYSDNGQGFDMDKVKHKIFGLNQKFHNHADSKGIGLFLVHNHVTTLGGNITVDSKVNEGATFTISFAG